MIYGYARVSTAAQDYAAQVAELEASGCSKIYSEAASGQAGNKRPQLARVVAVLQPGDLLVVVALSRLARSARDALNILDTVTRKGAGFRSLREAWADTTTPAGRLMVTIFSGLAEFDREMILERTSQGRETARKNGVHLGRRATLTRRQVAFVLKSREPGNPNRLTVNELVTLLGVSRSTINRAAQTPADQLADLLRPASGQIDLEDVIRGDP